MSRISKLLKSTKPKKVKPDLSLPQPGYVYVLGDRVKYEHDHNITGTITWLLTLDEESGEEVNKLDSTNPWYDVKWDHNQSIGFEFEGSLLPI